MKNASMTYVWIVLAVVIVAGGYFLLGKGDSKARTSARPMLPPNELTGAAPAFTLTDLDGKPVSLTDFRGRSWS